MNVLILGNSSDIHASHLKQALTQAGVTVDYLDTSLFPTQLRISWEPNNQVGYLKDKEHQWELKDIHSVFWRSFTGVGIPSLKDSQQNRIAFNDSMSLLRTMIKACPARWVNSWQAYEFHKEKPLQLCTVGQLGITIGQTIITNDPDQVIQFAQSHKKVISKPVYGGAHTKVLTDSQLNLKRLHLALSLSPVTLQEYIAGTNIRSYVIGNSIYSAEIRSESLDFRQDAEAELIPVELPEAMQQQCLAITKALYLEWTAIDWRQTPSGEYVFLEANPSPMFIHFEKQTGFPITKELVKLLIS
ncbi:MvdC/MvdD family ATP grasp protein [Lyngbya aestuarii]|uniref:MvdC/MvdD family ATP grasp protein n=1 Tax=Lyngbya aestuarii TaxID=118322 RepID=UPI00403DEADA